MSADKVRFETGISEKLKKLGCRKVSQIDEYHSLWEVEETKVAFAVPLFEDGDRCPEAMWPDVLASVAKAKTPQ